jgi:RHS repeat-associated protein
MMPAAKHFDPVVGVDIHIIQPPGPVPPVPIPHPYVGIVFDAFDYAPFIGATVKVNMMNRAIAGTMGKAVPPHIPIGGVFVPPPPANEDENFMGSATVAFDGDAATFMALPALSCQSVGMPPPPRLNPKKKGGTKSLVLPTSVVLPIPAGPPVLIGGPPTISLMSLAMNLIGPVMKALGKTGLGRAARGAASALADKAKNAWRAAFKNMPPGFLKCKVLKAEPVDVRTGEVVVDQTDIDLPGRIPLTWFRHYGSGSRRMGACGLGWETPADARLERLADGAIGFLDGTGAGCRFERAPDGPEPVREPVDGWTLHRFDTHLAVRRKGGLTWYFPLPQGDWQQLPVDAIVDPCSNSLHFVRGPDGLAQIVESAGRRLEVTSEGGLVRRIVLHHPDFAEQRTLVRYAYDDRGRLTHVFDALDNPFSFGWHDDGRLARHTNRVGLSFYYAYDDAGRCGRAWGDGGLYDYRFEYDPAGRWTNYTDSLGHRWSVELDELGQIVRETDPLGGVTGYTYDAVGRTTAVTDPLGRTTGYTYDERGNAVATQRPDGVVLTTAFDTSGRPIDATDGVGAVTRWTWDERGLLASKTTPGGGTWSYTHSVIGDLIHAADPRGSTLSFAHNRYGTVVGVRDHGGGQRQVTVDLLENPSASVDQEGHRTAFTSDLNGRLVRIKAPGGSVTSIAYDAEGNVAVVQDANGVSTTYRHAGLGELVERIHADGTRVAFSYDTEERLVGITDQRGLTHALTRDPMGRVVTEIDYAGQARRYDYDAAGQMIRAQDAAGRALTVRHDACGRIVERHHADGTIDRFAYDGNGRLTEAINPTIAVRRAYDPDGNLVREQQGDVVVESTFDAAGFRTHRRSTVGRDLEHDYDLLGRLAAVRWGRDEVAAFGYSARGLAAEDRLLGGLVRSFEWSPDQDLTRQEIRHDRRQLIERRYATDARGNLLGRLDDVAGKRTMIRHDHDANGRITQWHGPSGELRSYPHDLNGDRWDWPQPAAIPATTTRRADGGVYAFDASGNVTVRQTQQGAAHLTWDQLNRLTGVETAAGQRVSFAYDALGRRVRKRTGADETVFLWDSDRVIATLGADGGIRQEMIYRDSSAEPLACSADGMWYYDNDRVGAPLAMLTPGGDVVGSIAYDAHGAIEVGGLAARHCPFRFLGQWEDAETGLCYNRFRYYDPTIGCFLSADPLGIGAGENPYRYAPNPWAWVDPLGLDCAPRRTLYHYTTEEGMNAIVNSKKLKPSLKAVNPKDARYGDGQYLSDIVPGTKTPAQLSSAFVRIPFQGKRFTHYVEIDVTDLDVVKGRDGVFVVPNAGDLDLTNRIVSFGKN